MTENLLGALVLLLAVFPGAIGGRIYRSLVGVDWREKEWQGVLRLLGFSVFGATLYSVAASWLHLLPPTHLFPTTYIAVAADPAIVARLVFLPYAGVFLPYAGHLIGGTVGGLVAATGTRALARFSSSSAHPCAWDDFVRRHAPGHWVTVGLMNGEVYAGKLVNADVAVASGERDLVLGEPALYDAVSGNYVATPHQQLFISAANLSSIATYYEPAIDQRTVPPGQLLFAGGEDESKDTDAATSEPGSRGEGWLPAQHAVPPAFRATTTPSTNPEEIAQGRVPVKVRTASKLIGD
jgi:hypothetical protein